MMFQSQYVYIVSLIVVFFLILIYAFNNLYTNFMHIFSNLFPLIISGIAFLFSILAFKRYWTKSKEYFSIIWLCFSIGLGLWFLGETTWAIFTLILGVEIPFPSIADIFWLIGYIPIFISLFLYVKSFSKVLSNRAIYLATIITIILLIVIFTTLIIPIFEFEFSTNTIISSAYPILDVILLYIAILGLLIFYKGRIGKSWFFISLGLILYVIGDLFFNYFITYGGYYCGHTLELFFHFGYLSLILAFYIHIKEL